MEDFRVDKSYTYSIEFEYSSLGRVYVLTACKTG